MTAAVAARWNGSRGACRWRRRRAGRHAPGGLYWQPGRQRLACWRPGPCLLRCRRPAGLRTHPGQLRAPCRQPPARPANRAARPARRCAPARVMQGAAAAAGAVLVARRRLAGPARLRCAAAPVATRPAPAAPGCRRWWRWWRWWGQSNGWPIGWPARHTTRRCAVLVAAGPKPPQLAPAAPTRPGVARPARRHPGRAVVAGPAGAPARCQRRPPGLRLLHCAAQPPAGRCWVRRRHPAAAASPAAGLAARPARRAAPRGGQPRQPTTAMRRCAEKRPPVPGRSAPRWRSATPGPVRP